MLRIALTTSGLASLVLGMLLTIPAAEAQQPPVPELKVLVSQRVEELPQGPLCWDVFRAANPGFTSPADGYHAHPVQLSYRLEGTHRIEYAGGPTVTANQGDGYFIGAENWHRHLNPTATAGINFELSCQPRTHGAQATRVGITSVLPGIRPGPVPHQVDLREVGFAPGAQGPVHAYTGPNTLYVLEGTVTVSTPSGVTRYKAGDLYVLPAGVAVQLSNTGDTPVRQLSVRLWPAGEPPQTLRPDVRLPSPAAPAALPRTGGELPWAEPIAVLVGLVLLAAGIAMRRTKSA